MFDISFIIARLFSRFRLAFYDQKLGAFMSSVPLSTNVNLTAANVHDGTMTGAIGQTYNRPENRNPSNWDGVMTESGLGKMVFKNFVKGESLDFLSTQRWNAWCDTHKCKICDGGPYSTTYEVNFQWGDTDKYEYISEVCIRCLNLLNDKIVRNKQVNKEWIRQF